MILVDINGTLITHENELNIALIIALKARTDAHTKIYIYSSMSLNGLDRNVQSRASGLPTSLTAGQLVDALEDNHSIPIAGIIIPGDAELSEVNGLEEAGIQIDED